MRILVVTGEWPSPEYRNAGVFVLRQVEALRNLGIEIRVLSFRGRGNPLSYLKAFVELRRMSGTDGYDLIHAHFGQAGFISSLQSRVPVVVTFHGSDLFGLPGTTLLSRIRCALLRTVSWVAARRAHEVIFVSERLSHELNWRSGHVIPMGVDISLFRWIPQEEARETLGWPVGERSVLFVGDPANTIKRYELALEAVDLAARSVPDLKLHVCHNERQERVPYYMNAADVLLVTSSHESGPLVVREAVASGLPVVSVDVGDVSQRIGSVKGCVVCSDDRPETIAAGLMDVLRQGERLKGREAVHGLDLDVGETALAQRVLHVYAMALCKEKVRSIRR